MVHEHAATLAFRALTCEVRQKSLTNSLTSHLHKTQFRDVKYLSSGLVSGQSCLKGLHHFAAIVLDFHVDEVNDDDSTNIAQTQLVSHFIGGLKVVLEDRCFKI